MSQKKIVSITIDPDTLARLDEKVKETGAKSRSKFIADILQQSLSGRTFSLTEEQYTTLLIYSQTVKMSPGDVVKFVLARLVQAGEKVERRFQDAIPVVPTD